MDMDMAMAMGMVDGGHFYGKRSSEEIPLTSISKREANADPGYGYGHSYGYGLGGYGYGHSYGYGHGYGHGYGGYGGHFYGKRSSEEMLENRINKREAEAEAEPG